MSMAPSNASQWLVAWLDSRPRLTQPEVERILKITEARPGRLPESQSLARMAACDMHLRTFNGDANQQAKQLASYAEAVKQDDTQFANTFREEVRQKLRAGEQVVWKLHNEKLANLTESSQELLQRAGIEVARLEDGDRSPHDMVHTKMLLVDGQDWALSDRL